VLLSHPRIRLVVNLGRKIYDNLSKDAKLVQRVVDFEKLDELASDEDLPKEQFDIAFSVHGTTRAVAGSDKTFFHIEHDYILSFAKLCRALGIQTFELLSAQGASASSIVLYMRTKGEIEDHVEALGFPRLSFFRPGMLARDTDRFWEGLYLKIFPGMDLDTLARAMARLAVRHVDDARRAPSGSKEMKRAKLANKQIEAFGTEDEGNAKYDESKETVEEEREAKEPKEKG